MKFTFFFINLFLSGLFSIGCGGRIQPTKSLENDSVIAITVSRDFPQLTNEGKIVGYESQRASIFFSKNLILYKVPYNFYVHKPSDSGIYDIDKIEQRTRYLISEKGRFTGYFTDSSLNLFFVECSIDSVISQFWPIHQLLDSSSFDRNYTRSIDSLNYNQEGHYYSNYSFQNKVDTLQKGVYSLEYAHYFPAINYSLSSKLDTVKGMKLTNVEILNESRYIKEYNVTIDAVKQNRKITLLRDFSMPEIAPFFEFMKKRSTKN